MNKVDRIRHHRLPPDQLGAVVRLLVLLVDATNQDLALGLAAGTGEAMRYAAISPLVVDVIVDALSLLAARDRVALVAVDGTRHAKLEEVAKILDVSSADLFRLMQVTGFPAREDHDGRSYRLGDILEHFKQSRD